MVNPLINQSSELGIVIEYFTYNVTGSLFLSLMAFVIVIIAIALSMKIPIEWTAIIIFPLMIVMTAYSSSFLPVLGVTIIYLALLIAKNFFYQ
jgi:hypothetical protein